MRIESKVFIGFNKYGNAVYATIGFWELGLEFKGYFSVCFTECGLEIIDDETMLERVTDMVEWLSDEEIGDLLRRHPNITYSELPQFLLDTDGESVVMEIDYQLPEFDLEDEKRAVFTFVGGGQMNTIGDLLTSDESDWAEGVKPFVSLDFYKRLNELWRKYHLMDFSEMAEEERKEIKAFFEEVEGDLLLDTSEVREFIREHIEKDLGYTVERIY